VTIRAHWVVLDASQRRKLAPQIDSPDWQAGRGEIDREALNEFASAAGAVGQITCFSGQTVHIISGNCRSWIAGAIPVVGQLDRSKPAAVVAQRGARSHAAPMGDPPAAARRAGRHYLAQTPSIERASPHTTGRRTEMSPNRNVGYQPIMNFVNFGVLLQITPVVVADSDAVILDLQSSVLRRKQQEDTTVNFLNGMPIDRLNLVVQQFMTTLRAPLGKPVLVGGSTLEPISGEASSQSQQQLYLVIEATKL